MASNDIAIAGLSSAALLNLSSALHLPQLENSPATDMRANLYRSGELDLSGIESALVSHLEKETTRKVLVVYLTPWGFLEELISTAQPPQGDALNLKRLGKRALDIWTAYHLSALAARARFSNRCLLVNGHYPIDELTVADHFQGRYRPQSADARNSMALAEPAFAPIQEEAFWQLACDLAPECLETYASLESCAELLGRQPQFGFNRFSRRKIGTEEMLRLLSGTRPACAPPDPEHGMQSRLELHLLQLHGTQLELARLFELGRRQEATIAELQQRLRTEHLTSLHKAARKCMDNVFSLASRLAAPIGYADRVEAVRSKWMMNMQIGAIRSSGLFDDKWYMEKYPDTATSGIDPIEHFLRFGAFDGRNPSTRFDTRWYLNAYPDVARAGLNPLLHYIEFGNIEGRRPKPRLDRSSAPS